MHFYTILSTAALVACSAAAPAASKQFTLLTTTKGDQDFAGLSLQGFHTGAGESAVVGSSVTSDAFEFSLFKGGYIGFLGGEPAEPFTFGLANAAPYNSTAPAGYKLVTANNGENTPGFSLVGKGNVVTLDEDETKDKGFATFAICRVNGIAPYQALGPQDQLLWRKKTTPAHPDCADVKLHAQYS